MYGNPTQFVFGPEVAMAEVTATLHLAAIAAESSYGAQRLEVEARWAVDEASRTVTIEGVSEVARLLAAIFLGYARREFGPNAVHVAPLPTSADGGGV
jgi:hypothetical protein